MNFGQDADAWLSQSIDISQSQFDLVQMKGATSSSLFLVYCSHDALPHQFVLRVLDNQDWLAEEPDLAAHEAAALADVLKQRIDAYIESVLRRI